MRAVANPAGWAPVLAVLLALVGCVGHRTNEPTISPSGLSALETVPPPEPPQPPPGARPRNLSPERPAVPRSQARPVYPRSALAEAVDCTALLLYHMETDGGATAVRIEWEAPPPERHREAFERAIVGAVGSWRFEPTRKYVRRELPQGGTTYEEQIVPKAGRVRIRFWVADGEPRVE